MHFILKRIKTYTIFFMKLNPKKFSFDLFMFMRLKSLVYFSESNRKKYKGLIKVQRKAETDLLVWLV